nr:biotin/lipoate A/B protein ligase family protein [Spirochaetaceae bacterium]
MKEALKLIIDPPCSAARNMAVDHLLFEDSGAWLRLYQWEIPSVSLGYFQSSQEVNLQAIKDSNTALVRRITGGKAVLHQHELTYSLSVPVDWFPGALHESYKAIGLCLLEGLKQLGVDSELVERKPEAFENGNCFQVPGWYELISRGKKIIGSAQKRRRGRLLQHGSLLIDRDNELIRKIFSHNNDEPLE